MDPKLETKLFKPFILTYIETDEPILRISYKLINKIQTSTYIISVLIDFQNLIYRTPLPPTRRSFRRDQACRYLLP